MTMEQVLREIKQKQGISALRSEQLLGTFRDFSRNQLRREANVLKVFLSCRGNVRILALQNASAQEQQTKFYHLIKEMDVEHGIREEAALEVCSAFWRVALETVPPAYTLRRSAPEPTPDPRPKKEKEQEEKPLPVPDLPVLDKPTPAPKPKPRRFRLTHVAGMALLVVLIFTAVSLFNNGTGKRTRSDLAPYNLEDSIEDMLLAGTEQTYTYPDGTWMEFYYDDAGQEIYRVYVNAENEIENLFEATYDSAGRLVYHQIYDGAGNLLRSDSYDFHSSEDTAQRRVTLGDGRYFQGVSAFDENGYETFTLNHQDGTKTVYVYRDGGVLTNLLEYDAEGEETVTQAPYGPDWANAPKVYGPRQTVIGWNNGKTYTRSYVQGICGGAMKEYSVNDSASEEEQAAFVHIYDPMGNLLESLYYRDAQMNEFGSHEVYNYDAQGNYTGYTDTYYYGDGDYYIEQYDANGIRLTQEIHRFEDEGEVVLSTRYETEVDDQGREICIREYDGETGRLEAIEENEYDAGGNLITETRTAYYDDGMYNISVRNGDWKTLSSITYYPNGNVSETQEYTVEGVQMKRTRYYESGQIDSVEEYNDQGEHAKRTDYYENGQIESLTEYSDQGKTVKSTDYYENGKIRSVYEYNEAGDIIKSTSYDENGNVRYSSGYQYEYDADGNIIKETKLNEQGSITGWETVEYDADGNKAKTTNYDASGKLEYWTDYTYDDEGRFVDSQVHYPD